MEKDSDGGPAFPRAVAKENIGAQEGMSLRDWFAGQLMPVYGSTGGLNIEEAAKASYEVADAMLLAREK